MLKKIGIIFGTLAMLIALGVFNYPTVSSLYNEWLASKTISVYTDNLQEDIDYTPVKKKIAEYNSKLNRGYSLINGMNDKKDPVYESLLNINGGGIMGYIEIPDISQKLPIYHYSDEEELARGIGHIHGSSLPLGGEGTNCVLTGHRGLPNNLLFTRLDELETGDVFYIHILDETLAYKITRVNTVLPEETGGITIDKDKDKVTLITCTPYGINSHRLIITAERTEYVEEEYEEVKVSHTEQIFKAVPFTRFYISIGIVVFYILLFIFTSPKKRRKEKKNE